MRITDNIMVNNMLKNLSNNQEDLDALNKQLSSGKQFTKFSDAPIKAAKSLNFDFVLGDSKQFQKNIDNAKSWLKTSENAISSASNVLQRASELTVYGANDTLTGDDREKLGLEVKELRNEMISIANSKLGDDYLFSGQAVDTKPIEVNTNYDPDDPANDNYVNYKGDQNNIVRNISDDNSINVNVNAKNVFKENIETLNKLYEDLSNGADGKTISQYVGDINDAIDETSGVRANIGAKINRMDLLSNRLDNNMLNLQEMKSKNEDIDISEVVMNLKMKENVYRASLASASRVIQPSLVDFLK